jgi:Uma2 family endonuclease
MSTQTVPFVTAAEYLEYDRQSEFRNEFVFGEIVAMAGGTPWHSRIAAATLGALDRRLLGTPCLTFDANLRVCLNSETLYSYPDVTVVCGPMEYADEKRDTVSNPKLIVEVLSPSTRTYDLGDKARMYHRIPSLVELLFIEQSKVWIEHWHRLPNGHWDVEVIENRDAILTLHSIHCDVPVGEVYDRVEFTE